MVYPLLFTSLICDIIIELLFTDTTFTAEIDENVALSWRTGFSNDDVFVVTTPAKELLFQVVFGSFVTNTDFRGKYKFDDMLQDEHFINFTVMSVDHTDAGLYVSVDEIDENIDGCCVLVVTSMISVSYETIIYLTPVLGLSLHF